MSSNNSASNDTQSSQTRGSCFFLYWKAEGAHCWMLQSRVKGRTGKIPFARRVNSDARKTRGKRHPRQRTVISCRELGWAAMAKLSCRKSNINVGRIACGVARHVGFGWLRGSHGFTALFYHQDSDLWQHTAFELSVKYTYHYCAILLTSQDMSFVAICSISTSTLHRL